jgi:hypothetical protein
VTTHIAVLLALGLALGAAEEDAFLKAWNGIHGEAIARHIAVLASDEYEGRAPGTPGEEKTVAYVLKAFEDVGPFALPAERSPGRSEDRGHAEARARRARQEVRAAADGRTSCRG